MAWLRLHLHEVLFAAVVLFCLALLLLTQRRYTEPEWQQQRQKSLWETTSHIERSEASPAYLYANQKLPQPHAYVAAQVLDVPQFAVFPRPSRPAVRAKDSPMVHEYFAVLKAVTQAAARGRHGRVEITFTRPPNTRYIEIARVEIFRGETADTIDLEHPFGAIEYSPQSSIAATPPVETFVDAQVEPRKSYVYRLRTVGRMTVKADQENIERDEIGRTSAIVIRPPQHAQRLENGPNELYASAFSAPVGATTLANFELRLAGVVGKIAERGVPPEFVSQDYQGTFVLRVWLTEEKSWASATLHVKPGERIKGVIPFKRNATQRMDRLEFDSGYELVEIRAQTTQMEKTVEELAHDEAGEPQLDEFHSPQKVKIRQTGVPVTLPVASLREISSGKLEEFPKRSESSPQD